MDGSVKLIFHTSVFFSSVSGFFSSGRGLAWKRGRKYLFQKSRRFCYLLPPPPGHLRGGGLHLVFVGQLNLSLLLQEARLLYLVKILDSCTQGNNKGAHNMWQCHGDTGHKSLDTGNEADDTNGRQQQVQLLYLWVWHRVQVVLQVALVPPENENGIA